MANQDQSGKKKSGTILGALGFFGYLALKFKVAILAVLKFGWLSKGFLSMFLTIGVYSLFFGWPFACAVVLVLLIHEGGHWICMKFLGLKPKAPVFIPLVGAYTAMTELPQDAVTRAWVAFSGPLIGGVFAAAMYYAGGQLNSGWLMAAGSFGFLLNLIQLIPAKPLDGAFVVQVVSRWLLLPGSLLLCVIALSQHWILMGMIGVFSLFAVVRQLFGGVREPLDDAKTSLPQKFMVGVAYLSLTCMLAYLYVLSQTTVMDVVRKDSRSHSLPAMLQPSNIQSQADEGDAPPDGQSSGASDDPSSKPVEVPSARQDRD